MGLRVSGNGSPPSALHRVRRIPGFLPSRVAVALLGLARLMGRSGSVGPASARFSFSKHTLHLLVSDELLLLLSVNCLLVSVTWHVAQSPEETSRKARVLGGTWEPSAEAQDLLSQQLLGCQLSSPRLGSNQPRVEAGCPRGRGGWGKPSGRDPPPPVRIQL